RLHPVESIEEAVPRTGLKDIVRVEIDPESGKLAHTGCPERRMEDFLAGTEPKELCALHKRGFSGWFRKLFTPKKKRL
ncbi:MAG: hypothetical protein V3S11_00085, partial [Elusimicrobiota bacterium]